MRSETVSFRPVRFHEVMGVMKKIAKRHEKDTVKTGEKEKKVHHFFHREKYVHSPLEQLYHSEDIFTKKGCRKFLAILKLMQEKGVKKEKGAALSSKEKKNLGKEIKEFETILYKFEKNPDTLSPYLRDRYVAISFLDETI
ncbi:hypothetical protein JW707_02885 [Candidatus Woesearchaeota archaeon]|nr:hypothetical protein [Candidatus Woesearchaeota archaeon]